jgi:hypothetical protein
MRTFGIIILIVGIVLGIYALSMDTSVQVNYSGDSFGLPDRVNNLGLMNDRQNYLIVAGVLSIIGTILIIFKRSNSKDDLDSEMTLAKVKIAEKPKELSEEKLIDKKPLETLTKLKESGLISDTEYEEKQKSIIIIKEADDLNTWAQIIDNRIDKKAQPLIELVLKAKNEGIISEQEFEAKKKAIMDKCSHEIKMQEISINKDSYNRLSQAKKDKVEMYLETISNSELIVLHHNKIKVIDDTRWQEITKESIADNFEVIYQTK